MKDREYYERLISDSLDRELSQSETEKLSGAIESDSSLRQFRDNLLQQSTTLKNLPDLSTDRNLSPIKAKSQHSWWSRAWDMKLTIPVPLLVASAVLIIGIVGFRYGGNTNQALQEREPHAPIPSVVQYVETISLQPAVTIIYEDSKTDSLLIGREL